MFSYAHVHENFINLPISFEHSQSSSSFVDINEKSDGSLEEILSMDEEEQYQVRQDYPCVPFGEISFLESLISNLRNEASPEVMSALSESLARLLPDSYSVDGSDSARFQNIDPHNRFEIDAGFASGPSSSRRSSASASVSGRIHGDASKDSFFHKTFKDSNSQGNRLDGVNNSEEVNLLVEHPRIRSPGILRTLRDSNPKKEFRSMRPSSAPLQPRGPLPETISIDASTNSSPRVDSLLRGLLATIDVNLSSCSTKCENYASQARSDPKFASPDAISDHSEASVVDISREFESVSSSILESISKTVSNCVTFIIVRVFVTLHVISCSS